MFYALSKTLDLLVAPLTWALLLILAGAWSARRGGRALAIRAPMVAAMLLYLMSLEPIANAIAYAVESSATTSYSVETTYDVAVVLGGVVHQNVSERRGVTDFNDAVDRVLAGYDLIRRERARHLLFASEPDDALAVANWLRASGLSEEQLVVDDRSLNTHDNALRVAAILRERRWSRVVLITSAMHMARAAGCFRAAGVTFDTLAVDWRSADLRLEDLSLAPHAESLELSTAAIREAVGRVVYRVVGYSR